MDALAVFRSLLLPLQMTPLLLVGNRPVSTASPAD
jgi:hypothetical protein